MAREIEDQIQCLPAFASEIERRHAGRRPDPSSLVFAGAGDSYAASLFAHYLSNGLARAADPGELAQAPDQCHNRTVYIISVSGRTQANVLLAKRIKRLAKERIAVSADPTSPLARECDDTIVIPYTRKETITPGTLSFTLSLLAVASRIRPLPRLHNLGRINKRAAKWARDLKIRPRSSFPFVGSGIGYSLAAYGAFKIQEVLGQPADYDHTEQLGHSRLFSIRKANNIVCIASSNDQKTPALSRILRENGLNSFELKCRAQDPAIAGLEAAFSLQHLTLRLAKMIGIREASFLTERRRLALSSRLIY